MKSLFNKEQDKIIADLYLTGLPAQKIADLFDCYKQSILYSLKRSKVPRRIDWKRASREKHSRWNGGIKIIKGYRHLLLPEHHLARKDGYVPEHRLIMENKLGRKLLKKEVINHIDRNILNNDPNNLELFANNGEHIKNHIKDFKRNLIGQFTTL